MPGVAARISANTTEALPRYAIYFLYWTLQVLAFPFLLIYLALRIARNGAYARKVGERFGFLPESFDRTAPGAIWLHAVSVGEALAALQLLRKLRENIPDAPLYVSCSTLAGRAMAEQKLHGLADGVFYAPLDYRFAVRRVLRSLKPALVIVMETEIWPNLYREARRSGARLLIVNGRISDKALPRYERYRWFFRAPLSYPDRILAQDEVALTRYRLLGASHAETAGNLKYDFHPSTTRVPPQIATILERVQPSMIWIAASTMPPAFDGDIDEDDSVLDAFLRLKERFPGLLLILAPRRPERFDVADAKLDTKGIPFVRRTRLEFESALELPGVLLLDTIGELSSLFGLASVVFVGGSLPHRGGHNVLEPAAYGVPVVTGPHNENFAEMAALFRTGGALTVVHSAEQLAPAIAAFLDDPVKRDEAGRLAREIAVTQGGATQRAVATAARLHDEALPQPFPSLPARLAWALPVSLWRMGISVDQTIRSRGKHLPGAPVVSVGNLAMGGTGKTPFTIWLTRTLKARGHSPAVLLRGYGRQDSSRVLALAPGERRPLSSTGDEAQLLLRAGDAWVGIGADRFAAYQEMQRRHQPSVVLLDDGFQHWPLARQLDIVLIDALDPFRGGLFPSGRLREGFDSLSRAGAVVLTRTRPGRTYRGLIAEIRRHTDAPVFLTRVQGDKPALPIAKVAAFCGLGNPESFHTTLRELGIEPVFFEVFPDHHIYDPGEIRRLAARAPVLLTTEKDYVNIDPALAHECGVVPIPIRVVVENEEELLRLIEECLPAPAKRA